MKEPQSDIDRMIMESHYLTALEIESRAEISLPDMERADYLAQIKSLSDTVSQFKDMISYLKSAHESDVAEKSRLQAQLLKFEELIVSLTHEVSSLRKELSKQNDRNNRHNKHTFGKSSLKSGTRNESKPSREEEKQQYPTPDSFAGAEADKASSSELDESKVTSEPLDKKRGPRGPYDLMDAARVELVDCNTALVPCGMKILGTKTVDEYTRESFIKCTRYTVLILEDEFGMRHDFFAPLTSTDTRRPGLNVIDGTHCTPEFLSGLAVDRYQLHLPVYRELLRLSSEKMSICGQTVSNWLRKGHELLKRLLPSLKALLLKAKSILHIDETWCRVRIVKEGFKNGRYFKKYIWVLVNKIEKVVYFLYDNDADDSRATRPISAFLDSFIGGIQTDAYAVYRFFADVNESNERSLCWAHVRAKFKYASDISKDKDASWFVEQIGRLYAVEVENRIIGRTVDEIKERRNRTDVTEILGGLLSRANRMLKDARIHFGDMMYTALTYMINGWKDLLNYRHDGRYDIDNTEAERKIRPLTIGRKNTLFFGSEEGVEVATTYYTIIETCKLNGLAPLDYLTHVFRQLMMGNKDYESLLPGKLALKSI